MQQRLKEIFAPTPGRIAATVILAVLAHVAVTSGRLSQTQEGIEAVRSFWLTNFVESLPYLQTDNTALKFITFFVGAYGLVWLLGKLFRALDNLQIITTKKLRKRS